MSHRERQRLESSNSYTLPSSPGSNNLEEGHEVDYLQIEQQREDDRDQLSLYLRSERMVDVTKEERNHIRVQKQLAKDQGPSIPIVDVDPSAPPQKRQFSRLRYFILDLTSVEQIQRSSSEEVGLWIPLNHHLVL
ncbi:hypothetical protein TSUD_20220 [Trifolium subterraneum]|uniref:Uncharacterized protein n=1 Tax=Trifolium subterraneum TaxID=3900 RepID=A0A2Z6NEG0_TRISU|nr:hypothetical protein TSUD_20220 [Trifolium subterraneum]